MIDKPISAEKPMTDREVIRIPWDDLANWIKTSPLWENRAAFIIDVYQALVLDVPAREEKAS